MKEITTQVQTFLRSDLWRQPLATMPLPKRIPVRLLRIIVLAVRGFQQDDCPLRASALTVYALLSIVPVVAMGFGIAKGFGFEKVLEAQLIELLAGQEEVLSKVIDFSRNLLDNTKGGMVAGIGILVLIWSVMKVMGHIELAFNTIWHVPKARSLGRKFTDYLTFMLVSPILVIVSSSATVYITTQVTTITENMQVLDAVSPVIFSLLRLLPYGLIWILFILLYIFMPNTRVPAGVGIIAGIAAGTLFQFVQWGYIHFQVGISRYNAIYGSFAALPLFLVWLQISWYIVLFGAELAYACQHVEDFEFELEPAKPSLHFHNLAVLQVSHQVIRQFARGEPALTDMQISRQVNLPIRLTRHLLERLTQGHILTMVKTKTQTVPRYQPAQDIGRLSLQTVLEAVAHLGSNPGGARGSQTWQVLSKSLNSFQKTIAKSPENRLLKDL